MNPEKMENELRRITSRFSPDCRIDMASAAIEVYSKVEIRVRCCRFSCRWLCTRLSVARISRVRYRIRFM